MTAATVARRWGALWWILWGLLGIAIAVQVVRMRVAESAVRERNAQLAVDVRPQNGWGRALLAQRLLDGGNAEAARRESLAALEQTPLAVIAIRTLAQAQDRLGGPGAGEAAWQAASLMGWRDKPTQLWGVLRAMSNGQADIMAMRADALLRAGDRDGTMSVLLRQLMREPEVRAGFVERLALNPSWREHFLTAPIGRQSEDLDGLVATLRDLNRTRSPPSPSEIRVAVEGLIARGRFQEAAALHAMTARDAARDELLGDGTFDRSDMFYRKDGSPFDWTIRQVSTASANLDESEGRSMTVSTNGRAPETALHRYVRLDPGAYRLSYSVRGETNAPAALGVRLSCAPRPEPIAESSRAPLAPGGWQERHVEFRIGADCPILAIGLGGFANGAGEAQFDNFRLRRIDAAPSAQPAG